MEYFERMKALQADSDIKIKKLASILNVEKHSLGNYLNGKRTAPYNVLVRFAQYYHVTTDYIFGLTDDREPPYPVSAQERRMLEAYRTLSKEQRELIAKNIAIMQEQNRR